MDIIKIPKNISRMHIERINNIFPDTDSKLSIWAESRIAAQALGMISILRRHFIGIVNIVVDKLK